jgi:hypothetical protein
MAFESVRAYVQLASGLTDLTRARAMEAAQGLLSLPATGIATGTKVASQVSVLADELLAAAAANRSNLTTLVRDEVDAAIMTRLGLVPAQKLQEAKAEAARLQKEVVRLQSAASPAAAGKPAAKKAAARSVAKKAAGKPVAKKAAPAKTAKTRTPRSAVSTHTTPGDT